MVTRWLGRHFSCRRLMALRFGFLAGLCAAGSAEARMTIPDLVETTDLSSLAVSPDGRRVAFRTERASIDRNSYELRWYVAALDDGRVTEVGGGGEPIYADPGLIQAEPPLWLDNEGIFYRALVDGAIGVWRAAADGSGARALIVRDGDVEALSHSSDRRALIFRLGPSRDSIIRAERREYDEGILVDEHVDLAQNLFRGGSVNGRMASQRLTGRWFERAGLLWRVPREARLFDPSKGDDRPASDDDLAPPLPPPQIYVSASARSSDGRLASARWDGQAGSLAVEAGGGEPPRTCELEPCRLKKIAALAWRPGSDELLVTVQDRFRAQSLYLWNPERGSFRRLASGEGLLSGGRRGDLPCAVSRDWAVCVEASAVSPPRLVRIGLDSGARSILFDPNSRLRAAMAARVEHLSWRGADGVENHGTLILPRGPVRRAPLFINYYRCEGFSRGGEGDEWPVGSLLEAGFAIACVNSAPIHGDQDARATYEAALNAVAALVARLDRRGLIDPRRVGMGGFSFGSEAAIWIAMRSDLLAAVSLASSQIEPVYYWFNGVRGRTQPEVIKKVWGLGPPDETAERWREISPALNALRIKSPLLLQLPEQEARHVIELYARLTKSATPAELFVYPDEAHLKVQPRHRLAVYRRNLDWFRFWLQGFVDPDPEKAGQYRRWRLLAQRRSRAPGP